MTRNLDWPFGRARVDENQVRVLLADVGPSWLSETVQEIDAGARTRRYIAECARSAQIV